MTATDDVITDALRTKLHATNPLDYENAADDLLPVVRDLIADELQAADLSGPSRAWIRGRIAVLRGTTATPPPRCPSHAHTAADCPAAPEDHHPARSIPGAWTEPSR
jgi:hypothetical protein